MPMVGKQGAEPVAVRAQRIVSEREKEEVDVAKPVQVKEEKQSILDKFKNMLF